MSAAVVRQRSTLPWEKSLCDGVGPPLFSQSTQSNRRLAPLGRCSPGSGRTGGVGRAAVGAEPIPERLPVVSPTPRRDRRSPAPQSASARRRSARRPPTMVEYTIRGVPAGYRISFRSTASATRPRRPRSTVTAGGHGHRRRHARAGGVLALRSRRHGHRRAEEGGNRQHRRVGRRRDEGAGDHREHLGQLLSGQAAGVQIVSAGAAGGGSRIRIRGQSSLSLGNAPVVYVDGIKVNSDARPTGERHDARRASTTSTLTRSRPSTSSRDRPPRRSTEPKRRTASSTSRPRRAVRARRAGSFFGEDGDVERPGRGQLSRSLDLVRQTERRTARRHAAAC